MDGKELQVFEEDESVLKTIKDDFVANGIKWASVSPEKKLVLVWQKYERTSDEYKKMVDEVQSLKKQRKKDIDETEKSLISIRGLSQSKEAHITTLKSDNEKLSKQIQQLKLEREAYLKSNQAIADLLVTEGMTEFDRANPQSYIEQLVKDKNKCANEKREIEERYGEFQILKAHELNDAKEMLKKKEKELEESQKTSAACKESFMSLKEKHAEAADTYEKSLQTLKEDLADKNMRIEELAAAKLAAQQTLIASERSFAEATAWKEELETKTLELHSSQEIIRVLKNELSEKVQSLETNQQEIDKLKLSTSKATDEMEKLRTSLNEAMAMNDVLKTSIANFEREKTSLLEKLNKAGAEREQKCNETCKKQMSELAISLEHCEREKQMFAKEKTDLAKTNKKLQQSLAMEKEAFHEQMAQLQHEVDAKDLELTKFKVQNQEGERIINEQNNKLKSVFEEKERAERLLIEGTAKAAEVLNKELAEKEEELSNIQEQNDKQMEQVVEEKSLIEEELQRSKNGCVALGQQISESAELETKAANALIAQIKQRLQDIDTRIVSQVHNLQKMKEILQWKIHETSQLKKKIQEMVEEKESNNSLEAQVSSLKSHCLELEQKIASFHRSERTKQEQAAEKLKASLEVIEQLNKEKNELEEELELIKDENKQQIEKVSREGKSELEAVQRVNKDLNQELAQTQEKNHTMSKQYSVLEAEFTAKLQSLTTAQKKMTEEKNSFENDLQCLVHEKETLGSVLKKKETETVDLKNELQKVNKLCSKMKMDFDVSTKEREALQEELKSTQSALTRKHQAMSQLEKDLSVSQRDCQQKESERNLATSKIKEFERLNQSLTLQAKQDEAQILALSRQLKEKYEEYATSLKVIEVNQSKIADVTVTKAEKAETKIQELQNQLHNARKILHGLEEIKQTTVLKSKEAQNELKKARNVIESNQKEYANFQADIRQKDSELTDLRIKVASQQKQISEITMGSVQLKNVHSEITEMRKKLDTVEQASVTKECALKSLEEEVSTLTEKQRILELSLLDKEAHIEVLKKNMEQLQAKYEKKKSEMSRFKQERKVAQEESKHLLNELESMKSRYKIAYIQLKEYQDKCSGDKAKAEEMLDRHDYQVMDMTSKLHEKDSNLYLTTSQLHHEKQWRDHASSVHQRLLKDKSELSLKVTSLEKQLREVERVALEQKAIIQRLEQENQMIEEQLDQSLSSSFTDPNTNNQSQMMLSSSHRRNLSLLSSSMSISSAGRLNKTY